MCSNVLEIPLPELLQTAPIGEVFACSVYGESIHLNVLQVGDG